MLQRNRPLDRTTPSGKLESLSLILSLDDFAVLSTGQELMIARYPAYHNLVTI